jgi:hypothetical protein
MSDKTYEFETIGEATLRETWRATITDADNLSADELHDRITDELQAGNCEFVSERAEEERERDVRAKSIEECGPDPEPAYTIAGFYGDNVQPYTVTVYTHNGPEAALDLAHSACAEANDATVDEVDLVIVAIFAGEPELIDFDVVKTWTR